MNLEKRDHLENRANQRACIESEEYPMLLLLVVHVRMIVQ